MGILVDEREILTRGLLSFSLGNETKRNETKSQRWKLRRACWLPLYPLWTVLEGNGNVNDDFFSSMRSSFAAAVLRTADRGAAEAVASVSTKYDDDKKTRLSPAIR